MAPTSKSARHMILSVALPLLAGMGSCIGWAYLSHRTQSSYALPTDVDSFEKYLAYAGEPNSISLLQNGYFQSHRSVPVWHQAINVPSSLPGYVFDPQGRFVDWSSDPGDDGAFQRRWPVAKRSVSVDEARQLMESAVTE